MGAKNVTGFRKVMRGGKPHWIIDFRYTDKNGKRQRCRREATVQLRDATCAEARRLMERAAETGCPEEFEPTKKIELPRRSNQPRSAPANKKKAHTFGVFVETTFEKIFLPRYRPSTRDRYRALLRQGVLEHFGAMTLNSIGVMEIRSYAAQLHLKKIQLKGPINFVRTVLKAAHEAGLIEEPPRLPRLFKESRKLPDTYNDDEVRQLMTEATDWLKVAIALAAMAGLRLGEVQAMEVQDVDLKANRLYVRRALSGDEVMSPKSGDARVVPIAPELVEILQEAVKMKLPRARLVVDLKGLTPKRQRVLAALKKLQTSIGQKERSFHALRHYFCSALVRGGANVEAVRLLAGHSDLAITQRYVHAVAADLEAAVAVLGKGRHG